MDADFAVELGRDAIRACMMIGGPILLIGLIVGLVIGVLQAMTQVQDQTVSAVPKILLMMTAIAISLPWLSDQLTDFTRNSFRNPLHHNVRSDDDGMEMAEESESSRLAESENFRDDHSWN